MFLLYHNEISDQICIGLSAENKRNLPVAELRTQNYLFDLIHSFFFFTIIQYIILLCFLLVKETPINRLRSNKTVHT